MQISIFDGTKPFKIIKPIRLITLFSGYDSQALSLKYLGIPFEHYHTCEWAIPSIQALKDLHFNNDNSDYSVCLSKAELVDILYAKGVSSDYNKPLTKEQLSRYPETKLRTIYNNIIATKNLVSICNINGKDLEICNTDKYEYIMTYSFPCQDLSSAGKGAGMAKGSGTRSGLLWEVERLLEETKELPQVLLMENVPEVIGSKNIKHFAKWVAFLDSLGYRSKWGLLNAKDFGIAQNRNRCFMVSFLGDYYYDMPTGFKLEYVLKDFLDKKVDDSYYLKDEKIRSLNLHKERHEAQGNGFGWKPSNGGASITQLKPKTDIDRKVTLLLSNQGKTIEKVGTEVANTIMARDYKGFGNQAMNAVLEKTGGGDGITLNRSKNFERSPLPNLSRTLDTSSNNRVVEWEEIKCEQVATLQGGKWDKMHDIAKRVYSGNGLSPTLHTCGGGNLEPKVLEKNYRVRKLTEQECFKLMGVKQEDFEKIRKNQSKSSCYHLAGDSIVTTVLMAIFGQMFDVDWKAKINELAEELTND